MPALRRYRGPVLGSSITADYTVTFNEFNTVVCDDSNGVLSGKWFYEIEVLSAAIVCTQFGWADAGFEGWYVVMGEGV